MEQRGGPDKKSRDKEGGEHVAAPEEKVRALQAKETPTRKLVCWTCTRPTHEEGKSPSKKVECYAYRQIGHFKGSSACIITEKKGKKKKKKSRRDTNCSRRSWKRLVSTASPQRLWSQHLIMVPHPRQLKWSYWLIVWWTKNCLVKLTGRQSKQRKVVAGQSSRRTKPISSHLEQTSNYQYKEGPNVD